MRKNYIIIKKENGVTKSENYLGSISTGYFKKHEEHLCWDCENARADKCTKVADYRKLGIDKYSFISNGYMIINEENLLEKFVVLRCANFERDEEKEASCPPKPSEELKELKATLEEKTRIQKEREKFLKKLTPRELYYFGITTSDGEPRKLKK